MSCFTQFTFPLLTYHHWYCHSLALSEYIENIDNIEDINDIEDSDDIEDIEVIEDTDIVTTLPCKRILMLMILKMLILVMLKMILKILILMILILKMLKIKILSQPCPVWGRAEQAQKKQEGARWKPLLSQVPLKILFIRQYSWNVLEVVWKYFWSILEIFELAYIFGLLQKVEVVVFRKKKDKKDGAKGLAKAGSAVSLQVERNGNIIRDGGDTAI